MRSLPSLPPDHIARFWAKIQQSENADDCWPFTNACDKNGYGRFNYCKRWFPAHRIAYLLTYGNPSDLIVCHRCDNPSCCNPSHLFLGTHLDNSNDKFAKGRARFTGAKTPLRAADHYRHNHPELSRGQRNGRSKLSDSQIVEIRTAYDTRQFNQVQLGHMYHVSQVMIGKIVRRERWTHVPEITTTS